ncbi:hypothetical protein C7G42_07790 [Bradyrhizobium sp. MOS003]|nr:hypothetical protein C7G42_07790 [Bradyrhizobium sp. MOS003]
MEHDRILQFPCPVHDLSPEEFASRLTGLTEKLDLELSDEDNTYGQRLARIERASIRLMEISLLVARGRDRKRAAETFKRLTCSIADLRSRLKDA